MTKKLEVYKCSICGNIVIVMHPGVGTLVCCGKPMQLLEEKTKDVGMEKHVPVVEKTDKGIKVKVGSIPHPMVNEHYIEWIEISKDEDEVYIKFLKPGMNPEAKFEGIEKVDKAREYCNIHGLWSYKQ
ncbi:MAG: desulfoferrodoxin [Candidatus Verstraetearchaeota archaeon]|jgi:superoxide reductase|nr:desulfoferrodoxin [Candidatus Verstraetearchaeota archaeon]